MRVNMVLMLVMTVKMVLLVLREGVDQEHTEFRLCLLCLLMCFDALYACCYGRFFFFLRLLNMDMLRVMIVDMVPLRVMIVTSILVMMIVVTV